jgi:hypothetical protein
VDTCVKKHCAPFRRRRLNPEAKEPKRGNAEDRARKRARPNDG